MNGTLERRKAQRFPRGGEHRIVTARVRPGRDVAVVDVSAGGALIETDHRLLPGSAIDLHLATAEKTVAVRGRVLRCAVCRVRPSSVSYRGAIGFERHLPWFVGGDEDTAAASAPGTDGRPRRLDRASGSPSLIG